MRSQEEPLGAMRSHEKPGGVMREGERERDRETER